MSTRSIVIWVILLLLALFAITFISKRTNRSVIDVPIVEVGTTTPNPIPAGAGTDTIDRKGA